MDRDALLKRRNHVDTCVRLHGRPNISRRFQRRKALSCSLKAAGRAAPLVSPPYDSSSRAVCHQSICLLRRFVLFRGVGAWGEEIPSFAGVIAGIRSRTAGIWLLEQQTYSYIILLKLMAIIEKHMLPATCAVHSPPQLRSSPPLLTPLLAARLTVVLKETIPSLFYFFSPLSASFSPLRIVF